MMPLSATGKPPIEVRFKLFRPLRLPGEVRERRARLTKPTEQGR
jgi:hypothetical protein